MIRFLLNGMVLCKCLHTYVIFNIALSISHALQLQTAVFIELLIIRKIMHMSKQRKIRKKTVYTLLKIILF